MWLNIWIDCDDVLSETMKEVVKRSPLVEKWIKLSDITSYGLFEVDKLWISFDEAVDIFYSFFESGEYYLTQPVSGAYEKLYERKHQWHKLFVVTWRPKPYEQVTKQWVENHFPWIFSDYLFMNQYTENEIPKSVLCKEQWIELLVDDTAQNIIDINSVGIPWFLFNKPWNQWVENTDLLYRVYSWDEINLSQFF